MASTGDLDDVEQKRRELESNVSKLRASLRHWQQWEIEYEGMREELEDLGQRYSRRDLQKLEDEEDSSLFKVDGDGGNLLDRKERRLLIYDANGKPRSVQSIIGLLSRRVDYVERNVKSVVALLTSAEEDLATFDASRALNNHNDQDTPVTEIQEELDDDGKVVSSQTSHPGETAAEIFQSIGRSVADSADAKDAEPQRSIEEITPTLDSHAEIDNSMAQAPVTDPSPSRQRSRSDSKKRVSFAADTKPEHDTSEHPNQLPKEEQMRLFQSACSQLRQQLGKNIAIHKLDTLNGIVPNVSLVEGSNVDIASQILRMQQNRQAKRLLKAEDLDLKGAAGVLCKMAELNVYDLESPRLSDAVLHARETRSVASSSRESSPGVFSDVFSNDTPSTSLSSSPLAHTKDHTHLIGSLPGADIDNNFIEGENVLPNDDTPEEAAVRRQMLKYNMDQVGAVVAELNLEEGDEDDDLEHMDVDLESDDDEEEDDEEDEHGRTIKQVVSGDYVAEMRALEARLNAKAMVNIGPAKSTSSVIEEDTNKQQENVKPPQPKRSGSGKGVRFAEEIQIQEAPSLSPDQDKQSLERKRPLASEVSTPSKTKKVSRFKAARTNKDEKTTDNSEVTASAAQSDKSMPIGSRPIMERDIASASHPSEPDDMEPAFMQNEVRNEYHRLRNKLISQQGGFSKRNELDDDDDEFEEDYEEPEDSKKVSRFRAARLGIK